MQKGALKTLEVWKGCKKNHDNKKGVKIESIWFSVRLMPIFREEKGGLEKFCGSKEGPEKFSS